MYEDAIETDEGLLHDRRVLLDHADPDGVTLLRVSDDRVVADIIDYEGGVGHYHYYVGRDGSVRRHAANVDALTAGLPRYGGAPSDKVDHIAHQLSLNEEASIRLAEDMNLNPRVGEAELNDLLSRMADATERQTPFSDLYDDARRRIEHQIRDPLDVPTPEASVAAGHDFNDFMDYTLIDLDLDPAQLHIRRYAYDTGQVLTILFGKNEYGNAVFQARRNVAITPDEAQEMLIEAGHNPHTVRPPQEPHRLQTVTIETQRSGVVQVSSSVRLVDSINNVIVSVSGTIDDGGYEHPAIGDKHETRSAKHFLMDEHLRGEDDGPPTNTTSYTVPSDYRL